MPLKIDPRHLGRLLPPAPLAGRWWAWSCIDCNEVTLVAMRIDRLPLARLLRARGWLGPKCRHCGGRRLKREGFAVS